MAFCSQCGKPVYNGVEFCPACSPQISTKFHANQTAVTFQAPIFTPPVEAVIAPSTQRHNRPICNYHLEQIATGSCTKCGKYLCRDCCNSYGISSGDYAGQVLCYDCTADIVRKNVAEIKRLRRKTIFDLIMTVIFLAFGVMFAVFLSSSAVTGLSNIIISVIVSLYVGSLWIAYKDQFHALLEGKVFSLTLIIRTFIAPYLTIRTLIIRYQEWKNMNKIISSDSTSLVLMRDYLEYSMNRLDNDNSYIKSMNEIGEVQANTLLHNCVISIAANGEILRDYGH